MASAVKNRVVKRFRYYKGQGETEVYFDWKNKVAS